jgi:hypothetical protein
LNRPGCSRYTVKKALTNATIYFVGGGALYLLILVSPEWVGFYGLIFFYMIHFPGLLLVKPFYSHTVNSSHFAGYFVDVVLITVNAAIVFWISWLRERWKS